MSPVETERIAGYLKSLANPLRIKLIMELKEGPRNVTTLVERTGASQSYVSQQLMKLTRSGMLDREEKDNHVVIYSLRNRSMVNMLEMVRVGIQN